VWIYGYHMQDNRWKNWINITLILIRSKQQWNTFMSTSRWRWGKAKQYRKREQIENKLQLQLFMKGHKYSWIPYTFKLQDPDTS
jgi:hypothetical protein